MYSLTLVVKVSVISMGMYHAIVYFFSLAGTESTYGSIRNHGYRHSVPDIPVGNTECWPASKNEPVHIDHTPMVCRFKNLCFSNILHSFFILGGGNAETESLSVKEVHVTPLKGFADAFSLQLLSPNDAITHRHNHRYIRTGQYIMFSRISWSNIAHDIHDVLLPMFYTYNFSGLVDPAYTLFLIRDNHGFSGSEEHYRIISRNPVVDGYLEFALLPDDAAICYEEVLVGSSKLPIWYDWGVGRIPEEPLNESFLTSDHVRGFTSYAKKQFGISEICDTVPYGIILTRKKNRKILNSNHLQTTLSRELGMEITELSMEFNSISEIIRKVSCARFAIGMHGAILILTMFLPPGATLLEMFPYAINPDNQRLFRSMIQLPGMGIEYASWRNMDESKSTIAPKLASVLGFQKLSETERDDILNRSEVPPKVCCDDVEHSYRLYHDTFVDIPAIVDILKRTIR